MDPIISYGNSDPEWLMLKKTRINNLFCCSDLVLDFVNYGGMTTLICDELQVAEMRYRDMIEAEKAERKSGMTNKQFCETDNQFRKACEVAGIPPTPRQASKWLNSKGLAYKQAHKIFS
jgi:hypothetical protein